jgi:hypothetical protein
MFMLLAVAQSGKNVKSGVVVGQAQKRHHILLAQNAGS